MPEVRHYFRIQISSSSMQKIIDQITDQLVGLVKKDQEYYTPQQLLKHDIPSYIVERVRLLLEDKVLEDFSEMNSKWLTPDNELLDHAWKEFRSVAVSCTAVPHDYLYPVIHQTVNDIISVFVEPRKNMASYLFRDDEVLSFDEMIHRCERLTIYKHFGTAIPLYMKKRNLEQISLERCRKLINNLDARIVSGYSAEDWGKKLDLLFTLFGGRLEPNLLKMFFNDKGLHNAAAIFDRVDVSVTKSTFIEMLSNKELEIDSSDQINEEEQKKKQSTDQIKKEDSIVGNFSHEKPSENKEALDLASAYMDGVTEQDMSEILGDIAVGGVIEVDNIDEVESLNALFTQETDEEEFNINREEPDEDTEGFRSNLTAILDQAKDSFEGVVSEPETAREELVIEDDFVEDPIDEEALEEEDSEEPSDIEGDASDIEEEEEKPMWAQFLTKDQMDVMMGSREGKEEPEASLNDSLNVEDEFGDSILEEPEDFEQPEEMKLEETFVSLDEFMESQRKQWIKKIFSGKKKAYKEAVEEISYFKNWEEASKFVQADVFGKHKVDMFSEEAIGFIDALQTYFNEYKS